MDIYHLFLGNIDEVAMWSTDERLNVAQYLQWRCAFRFNNCWHLLQLIITEWSDGDTYSSGQWDLLDNSGSYDIKSINMEEGDRVTNVP
jgi:hypothetical protein